MNLAKTNVYEINRVGNWETVKSIMNCGIGHLPETYLGLLLGTTFKQKAAWQDLLQNFRNKLAHWKRKFLTKAGRLVLIKSTLTSLPVSMLSLFVLPCSVTEEME